MIFFQSDKKTIFTLFTIYTIANLFLLLNYNGIYWDDWVLYNNEYDVLLNMHIQAAGKQGYISTLIRYIFANTGDIGIFLSRVLIFLFLFCTGYFLFKVLKRFEFFSPIDRFFIVLFFIIAPLNSAKIALINFQGNLRVFIFFFAFYLVIQYLFQKENRILLRGFILLLFFLTFGTNSLLVFYAIVPLYIFYVTYSHKDSFNKNVFIFIKTKIDFILLPVVFYIIKSIYFMPSGIYTGYNSIKLSKVLSMDAFYKTFELNFIDPIVTSLLLIKPFIILLVVLFIFGLFLRQNNHLQKKDLYLFSFGFLAFFLGTFAYIAVGKIPSLYNWASRLQVLIPLGFCFMLYYGIQIISNLLNFKEVIKLFTYCILFLSFMTFHMKEQIKYNIDWMYQKSIIENFRVNEVIKSHSTFIVKNELGDKLVDSRRLGFYQLNGMSKVAFGDDKRFFPSTEQELKKFENFKMHKHYNFSTWEAETPMNLILKANPRSEFNKDFYTSLKYLLKLKYLELVNEEVFIREVKKLVYFDFKGKK